MIVTRAELARRVVLRLLLDGTPEHVARAAVAPGFFATADGLEAFARQIGVLGDDERVEG